MRKKVEQRHDARPEIINSARQLVSDAGWEAANSNRVAERAEVSKALVHYHFGSKRALLSAVADSCREGIARRRAAPSAKARTNPVDDFADWIDMELEVSDLRIALQLTQASDLAVRASAEAALDAYRQAMEVRVQQVFTELQLQSRIPVSIVVETFSRMSEGMAMVNRGPAHVIEAVWLGLLTLAD